MKNFKKIFTIFIIKREILFFLNQEFCFISGIFSLSRSRDNLVFVSRWLGSVSGYSKWERVGRLLGRAILGKLLK